MNGSVGNSLLLYIVIFVIIAVMLFYVGIISYSKAYRVKDNIIEIIEKYKTYEYDPSISIELAPAVQRDIHDSLKQSGYGITTAQKLRESCESGSVQNHIQNIVGESGSFTNLHNVSTNDYNYCVFSVNKSAYEGGNYYIVVTFVHFDLPIIGDRLNIPVYGETKILGKTFDY